MLNEEIKGISFLQIKIYLSLSAKNQVENKYYYNEENTVIPMPPKSKVKKKKKTIAIMRIFQMFNSSVYVYVCVFYLKNGIIPYIFLQLYFLFIMPYLKYLFKISTSVSLD